MKALLEKRAKTFEDARAILLAAERAGRGLTSEEASKYESMMVDVKSLGDTIERSRRSAEFSAELDRSIGPIRGNGYGGSYGAARKNPGSDLEDAAMAAFLKGGTDALNQEHRSLFGPAVANKDTLHFRAASPLSDVTGTAGAYTVPTGFYNALDIAMKWYGGMRASRATILKTATGQSLPYPSMFDTNNTGEWVAENTAATQAATEMNFGHITLNAYKASSKLVLVPIELLQDSAFDVQAFVANALGVRLGRLQNAAFTVGSGSGQPTGIVGQATSGKVGITGQTTTVIYNDLVDLSHAVDAAYRTGAEFMMHDLTAAVLEKLVDGNGRPLLNSTLAGVAQQVKAGSPLGQAQYTILGYPVIINNDMALMAANAKSILFGDMSKYIIRDVMDLMLIRFGELYMTAGQVGFLAFTRVDGNLQDAGTHPIQYYQNSAS